MLDVGFKKGCIIIYYNFYVKELEFIYVLRMML